MEEAALELSKDEEMSKDEQFYGEYTSKKFELFTGLVEQKAEVANGFSQYDGSHVIGVTKSEGFQGVVQKALSSPAIARPRSTTRFQVFTRIVFDPGG